MHIALRALFLCLLTYFVVSASVDVLVNSSNEKSTETINIQEDSVTNVGDISIPLPDTERPNGDNQMEESLSSNNPPKVVNDEYIPPLVSDIELDTELHKSSSSSQPTDVKDGSLDSDVVFTTDNSSESSSTSLNSEKEGANDSVLSKPVSLEETDTPPENEEIPTFKEFQRKVEEENAKQRLIRQHQLNIAKHHDSTTKLPTLPMKGTSSSKGSGSPNSINPPSTKADEDDSSRKSGNNNDGTASSEKAHNQGMRGESDPQGEHSSSSSIKEGLSHTNSLSNGELESGSSETLGKLPSIIEQSNGHKRIVTNTPTSDDSFKMNHDGTSASGPSNTKNGDSKSIHGGNEVRERSNTHNGDRKEDLPPVESPSSSNGPSSEHNQQDTNKLDENQAKKSPESGDIPSKSQRNVQESGKTDNADGQLETKESLSPSTHNEVENKGQTTKSIEKDHQSSQQSTTAHTTPPTTKTSPTQPPHPKTNVASRSCGSKLLEVSDSMENSQALLNNNPDEYMNQPCAGEKWFVLETCEAVQIRTIQIANFEFFSSRLKTFHVYTSDRYPVKQWELLGVFQALDEKGAQLFEVRDDKFVKYLKFEFLDHYGSEHYCPMSMVGVYGTLSDYIEDDHLSGTQVEDQEDSAATASILADDEDLLSRIPPSTTKPLNSDKDVEGSKISDEGSASKSHEKDDSKSVDLNGQITSKDNHEDLSSTMKQPPGTQTSSSNIEEGGSSLNISAETTPKIADVNENTVKGADVEMNHTQVITEDQESNSESNQASENVKSTPKEVENSNDVDKSIPVTPSLIEEDHVEGLFKKATDLIRNVAANFKKQASVEENQASKEVKEEKVSTPVPTSNETSISQDPDLESVNCTSKINISEIMPLWDRLSSCGSLLSSYHLDHTSNWMKKGKKSDFRLSQIILSLTPLRAYALCQYVRVIKGWSVDEFICIINYVQQLQTHNHTSDPNEMKYMEDLDRSHLLDSLSLEEENETESDEQINSIQQVPSPKTMPSSTSRSISSTPTSTNSNSQKITKSSTTNGGSNVQMPPLKKDIIYMRLNNRMVALEQKVNVSMNYLEELSQSHRRQMERQARSFNHTLVKLTETAESAEARDRKQQVRISQLERQLRELRNRLRPNALYHHHNHRHYHRHTFPRPSEPPENVRASPITTISDSSKPTSHSTEDMWSFITKDFLEVIGVSQWLLTVILHLLLAIILQLLIFYCLVLPRLRRCIIHLTSASSASSTSTANGHTSSSKHRRDSYHDNHVVSNYTEGSRDSHRLPGVNSSLAFSSNGCRCETDQLEHTTFDSQCTHSRFNSIRQRDSTWPLCSDQSNVFVASVHMDPVRETIRTRSESALKEFS